MLHFFVRELVTQPVQISSIFKRLKDGIGGKAALRQSGTKAKLLSNMYGKIQ